MFWNTTRRVEKQMICKVCGNTIGVGGFCFACDVVKTNKMIDKHIFSDFKKDLLEKVLIIVGDHNCILKKDNPHTSRTKGEINAINQKVNHIKKRIKKELMDK